MTRSVLQPPIRRLVALAVVVLLASAALAACGDDGDTAAGDEWERFTDEASGVSVAMPDEPETEAQDVATPDGATITVRVHVAEDEEGGHALGLGVFELGGASYDLDGGVQGTATSIGGTVESSVPVEVDGFDARDYVVSFDNAGEEGIGLYRLILLDDTAVQLQTVGPATERPDLESLHERLLESFETAE